MIQDEDLIKTFIQKISRIGLEEVDTSLNMDDQFTNSLILNLKNGGPAGILHIGSMSWVLKRPIEIFDSSNKLMLKVGQMTDCIPIKMQYHSRSQIGHWTLINSQQSDIEDRIYGNCFFDVISSQVNISSKKLREKLYERMTQVKSQLRKNKFIIKQIYQIDKDLLMIGAGIKLKYESEKDLEEFLKILQQIQPSVKYKDQKISVDKGQNMLSEIIYHEKQILINILNSQAKKDVTQWNKVNQVLSFNLSSEVKILYNTGELEKVCPQDITLYHELCHCWRYLTDKSWKNKEKVTTDQIFYYKNPIFQICQAVSVEEAETVGLINKYAYSQNEYRLRKFEATKNQDYLPRKYYGYDINLQLLLIIQVALHMKIRINKSWSKLLNILEQKNKNPDQEQKISMKQINEIWENIQKSKVQFGEGGKQHFIYSLKIIIEDGLINRVKNAEIKVNKQTRIQLIQQIFGKFDKDTKINLDIQNIKKYVKKTVQILQKADNLTDNVIIIDKNS